MPSRKPAARGWCLHQIFPSDEGQVASTKDLFTCKNPFAWPDVNHGREAEVPVESGAADESDEEQQAWRSEQGKLKKDVRLEFKKLDGMVQEIVTVKAMGSKCARPRRCELERARRSESDLQRTTACLH